MVGWGGGRTIITERDGFGVRGIRAHPENSIVLRLLLEIATGSSLFSCVVCVCARAPGVRLGVRTHAAHPILMPK